MTITKLIGYLIAIIGLVLFAIGLINDLRSLIPIPGISGLSDFILIIIGLAIIVIGIFLVLKSPTSRKIKEVPIYKGKDIVGYRRH